MQLLCRNLDTGHSEARQEQNLKISNEVSKEELQKVKTAENEEITQSISFTTLLDEVSQEVAYRLMCQLPTSATSV